MFFFKKRSRSAARSKTREEPMLQQAVTDGTALSEQLDMNLSIIRERTGDSPDIIIRRLDQVVGCEIRAAVIFIDGLVKDQIINHSIMDSLTQVSSMEIPLPLPRLRLSA